MKRYNRLRPDLKSCLLILILGLLLPLVFTDTARAERSFDDRGHYWEQYVLYTVVVKRDDGKTHNISAEDDDTVFNYYRIGDKVRHHGGLNSIEKYDKSRDEIIFCNACAYLNDIKDDYCVKCKCPLLK